MFFRCFVPEQVAFAALAAMGQAIIGTIIGLPGVILPQLTDPTSHDLFLNTSQVALFGKLPVHYNFYLTTGLRVGKASTCGNCY